MLIMLLAVPAVLESHSRRRPVFHSEADFQFALAWEIRSMVPHAELRLEYPPPHDPATAVDILVRVNKDVYPIELKYKTKSFSAKINGEVFHLKKHSAKDVGCYDFWKDVRRVEKLAAVLDEFSEGFVIMLTNDPTYWRPPANSDAGYADFSIHTGAVKTGEMTWAEHLSAGTTRGREQALVLENTYEIFWHNYSDLQAPNGLFKYVLLTVEKPNC